jgi:DNA-binding MarR family transcriptional regulator
MTTPPGPAPRPGDRRFQIVNYIGIANQLLTTHANQQLAVLDLPLAQFIMLNHFSHEPARGRTVGSIASAFQTPQPGVTKMLQRLVRKGLLEVRPDAADQRVKHHFVTEQGLAAHGAALARLMPAIDAAFADWLDRDVADLHALLFRLKTWLDAARDPRPPLPPPSPASAFR